MRYSRVSDLAAVHTRITAISNRYSLLPVWILRDLFPCSPLVDCNNSVANNTAEGNFLWKILNFLKPGRLSFPLSLFGNCPTNCSS